MAQLLVMYKNPQDTAAFDRHYIDVHIPLCRKIPGLRKFEITHGPIVAPAGPSVYYFIATLFFDDMPALEAAMGSPEGRTAGADAGENLGQFDMLIYESAAI